MHIFCTAPVSITGVIIIIKIKLASGTSIAITTVAGEMTV
jgi:hypothetical protein